MKIKVDEIISILGRGVDLLGRIDDAVYCEPVELAFRGTLGGHFRHDLDHYLAFLEGLAAGRIDYESRRRDHRIETDRAAAIALSREICDRLARLAVEEEDGSVFVRQEGSGLGNDARWMPSSRLRELDFLLGHTVHHQALTAIICRLVGVEVDGDYGVAPSTLRHRERLRPCAR
ncbi:MAG: hypothetical protein R3F07_08155 [Opitutaceae bacterium]